MKKKVIVIAEAGVNHNGKISIAKKLIDAAYGAKADYIKFQFFNYSELSTEWSKSTSYQIINTNERNQFKLLKRLHLSFKHLKILENYAKKKKIKFLLSFFDIDSLKKIKKFRLDFIKIPSGEITNFFLLKKISKLKKKIILSTGGSTKKEIFDALKILKHNDVSLLHCVTNYPASFESVNLKSMLFLKDNFKKKVGLSDHTLGISVPLAATALGAVIIEKHLTLSRRMSGPDHISSLEPNEFKNMVNEIRNVELSLGNYEKKAQLEEKKNILLVRKSIVAKRKILKNEKFTEKNLSLKRPGFGISAMKIKSLIGKRAKKIFNKDDLIKI